MIRSFLMPTLWLVGAGAFLLFSIDRTSADDRAGKTHPNVVVILTDDQGWGDLSVTGNPNISTPHIDSIAKNGARLDNFYVCAVCSPTRAEFLTGRYHTRMGVFSTSRGGERFNADEVTIADVFKGAGYATAAYGKWHSGMQAPYHPNSRGFDDYYGFCSGHWGNYFSPMLEHNGRLVTGNGFLIDDLTDHAIEFMKSSEQQPFFVYLPFNTPHAPMQAPREYWDRFKDQPIVRDSDPKNAKAEDPQFTRAALAMVANIDHNVGRLLEALKEQGTSDNTIVVFFSDNGPNSYRFNGGMRGRKGSVHEGGLRSPLVMQYPDAIPAGTVVEDVSGAIDLLPTLCELAGVEQEPISKPLDGQSFAGNVMAAGYSGDDSRLLFSAWNGRYSVRDQQYRYHAAGQLFDIVGDRGENHDVAADHPEKAAEMKAALDAWLAETQPRKARSEDARPFPLGHPDLDRTQLPARDAVATGGIERSNRFPNCSFFRNWTSTKDVITWDVEVVKAGRYEVQMKYACPPSSIGTRLRLTAGDASTRATVKVPNDVPLIGAENDLVPRPESYVKDWATMSLGTIELAEGSQTLTLHADKIPGEQAVEMRLLMFIRE